MRSNRIVLILFFCLANYWGSFAQNGISVSLKDQYQLHIRKAAEKIIVDGNLQEVDWQIADAAKDFWMCYPVDNKRVAPEIQTEVRLTYDDNFIYVGAICYGPNDYIIPTLKRDSREFWSGDAFAVLFDPVNEATNGFNFAVNPAGVQVEMLVSGRTGTRSSPLSGGGGSSGINTAWDNKWFVEVQTSEDHWTVEMAIPFKTLRFDPEKMNWGINFSRGEPRSNSWHSWSPVPVQFLTLDLGYAGSLIWDAHPEKVKSNISVIPYLLGSTNSDFEAGTPADEDFRIGGDAKIAVTSSLNLDLTLNPDFSQVEVDEQVTNLTTVNVRFPERRLFFLENSDLFSDFGIPPMRPFFSRRIGLDEDGNTIPILFGARLSGNLNKDLRMGLMNMQTKETEEFSRQNYTSLALHQQVLDRSVVRGYFHNRQAMEGGEFMNDDYNRTAGLEFNYFSQDGKWRGFSGYGFSLSDGVQGDNYFYNLGGGFDGRNLSVYTNFAGIGNNYYADMGWIPFANQNYVFQEGSEVWQDTTIHLGFQHQFSRASYTLFPKDQKKIIAHTFSVRNALDLDNQLDILQNQFEVGYTISFANTSAFNLGYGIEDQYPLLFIDFTDAEPLPPGHYKFDYISAQFLSDSRKFFSWQAGFQYGGFYNGKRLETSLNIRYRIQPWGNFGLNFVYNKLEFPDPYGSEDLLLIGPRLEFNFSRNLFWTTFLQYNTQKDNFNINSRLQWRFQPMSDFFIVYTDNYAIEFWGKKSRALVAKVNYWLNL